MAVDPAKVIVGTVLALGAALGGIVAANTISPEPAPIIVPAPDLPFECPGAGKRAASPEECN
jgi:hypothetical protein